MIADPLKYRGVFDYPNNQSNNLIDTPRDPLTGDAKVPGSSFHVLRHMGWVGRGKHTRYSGSPSTQSVLDQKAAWMSEWLRKGQYAGGNQQ